MPDRLQPSSLPCIKVQGIKMIKCFGFSRILPSSSWHGAKAQFYSVPSVPALKSGVMSFFLGAAYLFVDPFELWSLPCIKVQGIKMIKCFGFS